MSLDGYVAGPNPSLENPLGEGGDQLHEWAFPLKSFREPHGLPGGKTGPDDDLVAESLRATGAVVMGRRMFSGGEGPWDDDVNAEGWWGDEPPFHIPVFVLTQHAREPLAMKGGTTFTFVTDGLESAVEDEDAVLYERILGDDPPGLCGIDTFQQAHRARVVGERPAHHERSLFDQSVDELRVLVPARLVTDPAARPRGPRSPDDDHSRRHGVEAT